jgi:nitrate reductase NapE component
VLAAFLLRRFGLLPIVALALAGRSVPPARRRVLITVAASVYLGAGLLLVLVVAVLAGGLTLVALTV